jgi:acetylornithine/LysW-gamma-L-lysine aminotransferase
MSGFIYSKKPIQLEAGDGLYLYDDEGNEYLDFGGSYACVPLGHDHDKVKTAVEDQLSQLTFTQASYPTPVRQRLYETLADVAPGSIDNVWLCNSGTEANEAAMKFARSATGNPKIVATEGAFHGRTMGSLSVTWKDKYRKQYEPLLDDVEFVPYNDATALDDAVDVETAAVIFEPIQGEGGINPATEEFLETARAATREVGAALILDEIQTGLGRTGTMWNCERSDVVPDVVTSAKGLGNGLPIGATLCRDWLAEDFGSHASTFGGNPVIAAAGDATVSTITEQNLPAHAADVGTYLQDRLVRTLGDDVRDVRGEGLMIGIELEDNVDDVVTELAHEHGILVLSAGKTVVRLLPPLTVGEDDAERVVDALAAAVN